jgi:hypothetical protein
MALRAFLIMRNRSSYNPKRRICENQKVTSTDLQKLASRVNYGGNPEHKRNPGDFELTPPAMARPDKTLCDEVGIFSKKEATRLIRKGIRKGLISVLQKQGFPQNIWAVSKDGLPLEAQLENEVQGIYHGYPMPENDPLCPLVLERWRNT